MKNLFLIALTTCCCGVFAASPVVTSSPVEHLFIPKGFDNNDNVELFVKGQFPNTCYSRNKAEVKVNDDQIDVTVTALVSSEGRECNNIEIAYLENVTVGSLQAGDYTVTVNGVLKDKLVVAEARSSSVDDYIYANVDYIDLGFTGGLNGEVFLVGRTADCVALDRIETITNSKDTLSILPIMKIVSNSCSKQRVSFSIPVKFDPETLKAEEILLFVKTMDGKSITSLLEK